MKHLYLHSQKNDPTYLHEQLGYGLFHQMGIPAPRSAHARMTLNGDLKGLFGVTEVPDGRFTDYWFPRDGDGNLYKEVWITNTDPAAWKKGQKTNEDPGPGQRAPGNVVTAARALMGANAPAASPRARATGGRAWRRWRSRSACARAATQAARPTSR